jgi:hypothetical protein
MKRTSVFLKMGLALLLVFGLSIQTIRLSAQCNVTNTGSSAAPTCSTQSLSLGAGESRNITFTSGVTYTFSFTNNPQSNGVCVGGTQYTANPVNVTILSPTGTVVTGMYRNSGTWSGTSATLSYKIADATTASISSSPAAVCAGGTTAALTGNAASVGSGSWSCTAVPSGGNAAHITFNSVNAENSTVTVNSAAVAGNYTLQWQINNGGCTSSATTTLTVSARPAISSQPGAPSAVCAGGTSGALSISATGGTPSLSYQWQYSSDNTSWSNASNGTPTGATYTNSGAASGFTVAGISTAGTYYYRGLASASGAGCTSAASNSASFTVAADPSISAQPSNASSVCVGGNASFSYTASGGTPSLTHQWQYSTDGTSGWANVANGTPNGSTYSGQTSNSLNVSNVGSVAGTHYYRSVVSAAGSDCATVITDVVSVTVAASPSITAQPTNATAICAGGSTSFSYSAAGGTPSLSHQWQYSADGSSGWANVTNGSPSGSSYSGQNSASLSITNIGSVAGTHYYRSLVSASGGNCSNAMTDVVNVSVTEVPTVTSHPSTPDAICAGGTSTAISVTGTGGTPSLSYVWQYSADSLNWNDAVNNTPTGAIYTNSTSASGFSVAGIQAAGNHFYRALLTASGSGCTSAPSNAVKLQVFASPSISATSLSNDSMCAGGTESASVTASGGSYGLQYQWQYQLNGNWTNVANQIPAGISYTNETTASMGIQTSVGAALGSFSYRCVVMISAGGGSCDTAVSSTLELSVLPSVWLGITGNASDPSNWLKGCVPVPGSRVEVNNTAVYDLPLTSNLTVSKLNFNGSGKKVILGVYDLTADSVTGADATNYIQTNGSGKLCMNLSTGGNKSFPVGLSAFNPVEITNNTAAADNFCVRILDEVYSEGTSGSVLSNDPRIKRTWDISKGDGSSNSGAGVDFKFWWNTNEDALNPSTFYLSHYDGTSWVQQPGTATVSGRSLTYTGYMGGFSPFALNGNQPLPVSWLYVKGDCSNGRRSLSWATATEVNNRAFIVEGSADGNVWNKITEVAGSKESSTVKTYQVDINMDYNYVRILQEDYDGAFDYSEVVYMNCSAVETEVAIVPNPSEGIFRILGSENLGTYVLFNALGQKVLEGNCSTPADRNLDLTGMEKGIYSLRISGSGKDILRKLVLK